MIQATLVLVCKRPALGIGKQRLAAKLGQEAALQIAEALLACALEDVLAWPNKVIVAPADRNDCEWATQFFGKARSDINVFPQFSGNLGERLNTLDHTLRTSGFNQLIYIGSDAPDIGVNDLNEVSDILANMDTVFKPTMDGGVSIMASRKPWPDLTDLPWSTSKLGKRLAFICRLSGHSVSNLSEGFDVDELEDLVHLVIKLAHDHRPARQALCKIAQKIIQQKSSKQKVMMQCESRYA